MKKIIIFTILVLVFPLTLFLSHMHFPKKSESQDLVLVPSRSEQPKDTEIISGTMPIHYWQTHANTPVYFVPTEKLPIVDITITFDAGSSRDNTLPGLAALCSYLLDEGTSKFNAEQIAEQFENVGAEFNTRVTRDRMVISLRTLSNEAILNPVVDLLADIIAHANFNETSVQQLKNQVLSELKQNNSDPDVITYSALYSALYPNHPYGHLISGTAETVTKIQRQDLVDFHKKYFVSQNASITIVGGIHRNLARDISNTLMSGLSKGEAASALPAIPDLITAEEKRIFFRSQQTHVLLGANFHPKDERDYYVLQLGNYILGEGSLVARLFKELRDKRGYTYYTGSSIRHLAAGGSFIMHMQTKSSVAANAEQEFKKILTSFVDEGPTEAEVAEAKHGMIGGFALSIANNARIADTISEMTFYQIPLDNINHYSEIISGITREEIQEVFKNSIHPDKMALVSVGENER